MISLYGGLKTLRSFSKAQDYSGMLVELLSDDREKGEENICLALIIQVNLISCVKIGT